MRTEWGLLPQDIIKRLREREWDNRRNLKMRLKGDKVFPIKIGLKPPRGNCVLNNLGHFNSFIKSWRQFSLQDLLCWETINYQTIDTQKIPTHLIIPDIQTLALILGEGVQQELNSWQERIKKFISMPMLQTFDRKRQLFDALIDNLSFIENRQSDIDRLLSLLPQLYQGMGNGQYLRALPVKNVDTKFIETNLSIIENLLDTLYDGEISACGGLLAWLGCMNLPKGWIWIRPLCDETRKQLADIPLLQLATETLLHYELPASNILIVENMQSGLALPSLPKTIAVIGGGKNLSWMTAPWLASKNLSYWGDIDLEGLAILSDARNKQPHLKAIMMDEQTIFTHLDRMVDAPCSHVSQPANLTIDESDVFKKLLNGDYGKSRLEQEKLNADYIIEQLK